MPACSGPGIGYILPLEPALQNAIYSLGVQLGFGREQGRLSKDSFVLDVDDFGESLVGGHEEFVS